MASESLLEAWHDAILQPFQPIVAKESQFQLGFSLLVFAMVLTAYFSLNPSFINVPAIGIPASLAFGFGAVYMICAVGVYV